MITCFRQASTRRIYYAGSSHRSRYISQETLQQKYGEKIKKRLEVEGVRDISELKERTKKQSVEYRPDISLKPSLQPQLKLKEGGSKITSHQRQDGSPVRPLSSILNLDKLFSTPHTSQQVTALWNARHAANPGQLSAVIQADKYESLIEMAKRYPSFVLPLPKDIAPTTAEDGQRPYEFYFLEWSFYNPPPDPRDVPQFPLDPAPHPSPNRTLNPPVSVLLFTPLGEYKLHNSYATSHLTLTNYTDLVQSHGIVLLRGEITPSESDPARLRLKGVEAQFLALAMQKFYLKEGSERGPEILAKFHEKPGEFRWEDVIQICDFKVST